MVKVPSDVLVPGSDRVNAGQVPFEISQPVFPPNFGVHAPKHAGNVLAVPLLDALSKQIDVRQPGGFEGLGRLQVVRRPNRVAIPQLDDHAPVPFDGDAAPFSGRMLAIDGDYSVIARVDQRLD